MTNATAVIAWPAHVRVLIPAYKAAESLANFLPRVTACVPARALCVVDDGSGDGTEAICRAQGIDFVAHPHNRGKGAALATGFARLIDKDASWIITMDADGQHAPEDLPFFLTAIDAAPDAGIIIGARSRNPRIMPWDRIVSNTLTSGILSLVTGVNIRDSQCGYRAYNVRLLRQISIEYDRFEMESEVIVKARRAGFATRFISVRTVYSKDSLTHSNIAHVTDTLRWIKAIVRLWLASERRHTGS